MQGRTRPHNRGPSVAPVLLCNFCKHAARHNKREGAYPQLRKVCLAVECGDA
jgi:hypothetical protein